MLNCLKYLDKDGGAMKRRVYLLISVLLMLVFSGCRVFNIDMPSNLTASQTIDIVIEVTTDGADGNSVDAYVCIELPTAWTINTAIYNGTYGGGTPIADTAATLNASISSDLDTEVTPAAGQAWSCYGRGSSYSYLTDYGRLILNVTLDGGSSGSYTLKFTSTAATLFVDDLFSDAFATKVVEVGGTVAHYDDWQNVNSLEDWQEMDIEDVAYGGGYAVVVGTDSSGDPFIRRSSDFVNWTTPATPPATTDAMNRVIYADGSFVAVGPLVGVDSELFTSTDGDVWTAHGMDDPMELHDVASDGNGNFVAVGYFGIIYTTSDLTTWTSRTSGTTDYLKAVTYGNGNFVVAGDDGTDAIVLYSDDGITWNSTSIPGFKAYTIAYGYGRFVIGGDGDLAYSDDFVNWTVVDPANTAEIFSRLDFYNGTYFAGEQRPAADFVGMMPALYTSTDGETWTARSMATAGWIGGFFTNSTNVYFAADHLVIKSQTILHINASPTSPELVAPADGVSDLSLPVTFKWNASEDYNNDALSYDLYVCTDNTFVTCPTPEATLASNNLYGQGMYYAGGGTMFLAFAFASLFYLPARGRRRLRLLVVAGLLMASMLLFACGDGGGDDSSGGGDGGGGGGGGGVSASDFSSTVNTLNASTTYYWMVSADDGNGGITNSPVRSFTTQ